ncbi:hypothetical protein MMC27_002031 [Xylographa pallens]|nr:hypothetical protein [Xylographa pallens]
MASQRSQKNLGKNPNAQSIASQRKLRKPLQEEPDRSEPGFLTMLGTALSSISGNPNPGKSTDRVRSRLDDMRLQARSWYRERAIEECLQTCAELERAENMIQSLKEEYITLNNEKSVLESRLACQDVDVRRAQESAFDLMVSSIPKATDDEVVRAKLKSIRAQWKMFAKEWAVADIRDGESAAVLFDKLMAPDEKKARDGLWNKQNIGKAAVVLLNAELARFIGDKIISQPFTAAFDYGTMHTDNPQLFSDTMETLNRVYDLFMKKNEVGAHAWRSQTVELIELPEQEVHPSTSPDIPEAPQRKENYYRKLVTDFESSNAQILYRECEDRVIVRRRIQLVELFRSIGELTSKLWLQKVAIRVVGSDQLLKVRFENGDDLLDAHAIHKLEDGDTCMDGMPIQVVVEPAIVAGGNERGESYEEFKVWGKAVVWMSSGAAEVTQ